jgi:ABC-type cobalamin/Fe3+-siderophores transport system ATPase subunit
VERGDARPPLRTNALALLHRGRLVAAGPTDAVLQPAILRDVFGIELVVLSGPDCGRIVVPTRVVTAGFSPS